MELRFAKLRGLIRAKFGTQAAFAEALNIHPTTLSQKLRGMTDWTRVEIETSVRLLGIPTAEIAEYFEM